MDTGIIIKILQKVKNMKNFDFIKQSSRFFAGKLVAAGKINLRKAVLLLVSLFMANVFADDLGEIAGKYWTAWKKTKPVIGYPKKCTPEQIRERRVRFNKTVKEFAPHWLEEFAAVDRVMNWEPGSFADIILFGVDYRTSPAPHECTSWLVKPDLTGGKNLLLHKNRDSKSNYLVGMRRQVPGKNSWIGHGNYGNIGTNCGINSKALAVVMNSGDKTLENNFATLQTVHIARILLEDCDDAPGAVKLLEKIIAAGGYSHGSNGSIWFITDPQRSFVVEHNAKYFHAKEIFRGMAIRANAWHFPEMLAYSLQEPKNIVNNGRREYAVRKALLHDIVQKGRVITPPDMAHAARISKIPEAEKCYPLCGRRTVAGTTFVIDTEFPEDLSYASFAFGPPRHTFFIPVPVTIDSLPEILLNGKFCNEIFKRFQKGEWKKESELQEVESKMNAVFEKALNDARKILRNKKDNAKKDAAAILKKAFTEVWEIAVAAGN